MICDAEACRITIEDTKVSLVKTEMAARQDCKWVDIMFVFAYENASKFCANDKTRIINQYDMRQNGAYGLKMNGNTLTISNNKTIRGQRPWVYYRETKASDAPDNDFNDSDALSLQDSLEF